MAQLHIMDISKNAATGLITVEVRVVEPQPFGGPEVAGVMERFHVEALEIASKYNGSVERWLESIGRQMLNRHKLRTAIHDDIHKWHGQKMDIKS